MTTTDYCGIVNQQEIPTDFDEIYGTYWSGDSIFLRVICTWQIKICKFTVTLLGFCCLRAFVVVGFFLI